MIINCYAGPYQVYPALSWTGSNMNIMNNDTTQNNQTQSVQTWLSYTRWLNGLLLPADGEMEIE